MVTTSLPKFTGLAIEKARMSPPVLSVTLDTPHFLMISRSAAQL